MISTWSNPAIIKEVSLWQLVIVAEKDLTPQRQKRILKVLTECFYRIVCSLIINAFAMNVLQKQWKVTIIMKIAKNAEEDFTFVMMMNNLKTNVAIMD